MPYSSQSDIETRISAQNLAQLVLDNIPAEIPAAPLAALHVAAGALSNGVYLYRVLFQYGTGLGVPGVASQSVTVSDNSTSGKVDLSAIPVATFTPTARLIYRTKVNGSAYFLLTTIADNTTTTFTDNVADTALGSGIPTNPVVAALIAKADAIIDGMLAQVYDVPMTGTIDPIIVGLSSDLASVYAMERRFATMELPKQWKDVYNRSMTLLQQIGDLEVEINATRPVTSPEADIHSIDRQATFEDPTSAMFDY